MTKRKPLEGRPSCAICRKPLGNQPRAKARSGKPCHARCLQQAVQAGSAGPTTAPGAGKGQPKQGGRPKEKVRASPPPASTTGLSGSPKRSGRQRKPKTSPVTVTRLETPPPQRRAASASPFEAAGGDCPDCVVCGKPRSPRASVAPAPGGGWAHAKCVPEHSWLADRIDAGETRSHKASTWRLGSSPSSAGEISR